MNPLIIHSINCLNVLSIKCQQFLKMFSLFSQKKRSEWETLSVCCSGLNVYLKLLFSSVDRIENMSRGTFNQTPLDPSACVQWVFSLPFKENMGGYELGEATSGKG